MQQTNNPIAIIVAMQKELDLLLPLISNLTTIDAEGHTYYEGVVNGRHVVATKCGIGKVNAALGARSLIENFHPSLVINSGVAGGTGSEAGILDIVVATSVAYHDVWCGPGTVEGEAAGCPARFTGDERVTSLHCLDGRDDIKHGLIASGDIFISRPEEVARIRKLYPDVLAVDMESAAIAHTCYLANTPFVAIRVVSDTPGEDDNISQYETFWEDAPRHTFQTLTDVLSQLPEEL